MLLAAVLAKADPRVKAEACAGLGLRMTYHPAERRVAVEVDPSLPCSKVRVGGASCTIPTWPTVRGELDLAA
jgi:hypothetical protein